MGVVSLKFKRSALALVPVLALLGTTSVPARASVPAPPNAYDAITEFDAYAGSGAFEVITGPDGNLWYTGPNNDRVVKADPASGATLSTVLLGNGTGSCAPTGITIGPDRNIWVACFEGSSVVRINPTTLAHTAVSLPATALSIKFGCTCPVYLAAGPDSYLWVTENGPGYVTKINVTTLAIHRYALPAGMDADPRGITVGSDGKLWIAEAFINRIGRMTTSGTLTTFAVPTSDGRPWGMVTGPDGNVYYTEINGNKIGRITTSGVSSEFPIPTSGSQPRDINVGPDGNLWFAEYGASKIGSMTLDGMMQEVATTTASAKPFGIVTGPDGNLWFTEINSNKIAKMGARHSALTLDKTAIGFGNINIGATTATQRITLTNNGAESLAGLTPSLAAGGAGGPSGSFASGGETCSGGSIAAAGTCYQDVSFTATSTPGSAGSRVDFLTDAATNYQQKPSAGLSASVNVPTCASVAVAPSVTSPQNVGTAVTLNATSAGCTDASPNYRFYLRSPAAAWSIVQPFSTSPSFAWNTTGYAPGTYLIGVWVKDALSTKTYDAYAFGTFTLQSPNCTSTNMSGSAQSPQVIGATVTFTASALGCPSPRFQWWVRNPEAIWSIAVPFAAGNTFSWDTTTLEAGTWQIGIWAKQVGSSKSYDAFSFLTYTLTTAAIGPPINQPCSAVNADATPASPQDKGTAVTLTATPFGCDAPLYKFWIRDTSAVWAVVQDYSPTNTYAWSTVSRPAGTYLVGVWIKQTGDSAKYEGYSFITYTLTIPPASQPCSSVGITSDVASPQPPSTSVTFTGAALGCGSPTYRFFVAPPGGAFAQVQDYSAITTYLWNTAGLTAGPYQVGVWARNAGSTKSYEAFAFITFQLTAPVPCATLSLAPTAHGSTTNDILSQSPQPAGIKVNWSAASTCDNAPEYAFYVQKPGSSTYSVLHSYGASATFLWNTAGLPRGNYKVKVLVRNQGSATPYDTFAISAYELV